MPPWAVVRDSSVAPNRRCLRPRPPVPSSGQAPFSRQVCRDPDSLPCPRAPSAAHVVGTVQRRLPWRQAEHRGGWGELLAGSRDKKGQEVLPRS